MKLVNTMLVVEMLHWCAGGWILKGGCAGYEVSSKDERKLSLGSVQGGATSMGRAGMVVFERGRSRGGTRERN
jgi:hypothetical protein